MTFHDSDTTYEVQEKHTFTTNEILEKGSQMKSSELSIASLEDEAKAAAQEHKARIKALSNSRRELAMAMDRGYEFRNVECRMIKDFGTKERIFKAIDDEREVKRTAFTKDDYQREMDFEDPQEETEVEHAEEAPEEGEEE